MAKYETKSIRNVVIIGQGGTGKTSLSEALLYVSGKTDRLGRVDDGTSTMDYEPEEQKRHITISSAMNYIEWNKHKVNIIDTPGDPNFIFDTQCCIRVADGAVVVIDAVSGVEFQTQKLWDFADNNNIPRLVFVNRMDRERADFYKAIDSISQMIKAKVTPIALPIGKEDTFQGVVDLVNMKALYPSDHKGGVKEGNIPDDMMEDVNKFRESMMEDIAETEEALMDKYLETGELSPSELLAGLRKAVISRNIIPAICGSAIKTVGIHLLADLIVSCLPSPIERGPVKGKSLSGDSEEERAPDPQAPFSAWVFKTIADPYAGRLNIFRVFSGTLPPDSSIYNANKKINEKFGGLFHLEGKAQKQAETLIPGDIAAVAKLKETATGDTLCSDKAPLLFEKPMAPPAVVLYAIEPKSRGDEEKIIGSLHRLVEEDPTLRFYRDDQTKEMILAGLGQVHIEVTVEKMRRKFGVEVNLRTPKVPYKETIKGKTNVQGKYKKQSGGRGQYGDCWLELEPLPRGAGFEFVDRIVGGVIPQQFRPAVEKGVLEAMEEGVLAGYPVVDVKVSLVDGSYHVVDSSELAFKIAGSLAFKKGMMACQPTLLEPIVQINIEVPEEYMGDVIGDLNSRRGKIVGMEAKGSTQIIKGLVPLAEILRYAPDLTSITSGRGSFTYEFSHYEEVPAHIAEKIIAEAKKAKEESSR
ncbi:MAG: elongation factor G [Syntrophales bacterium]|nr:elongation factor G [Syntrophales bacterium]